MHFLLEVDFRNGIHPLVDVLKIILIEFYFLRNRKPLRRLAILRRRDVKRRFKCPCKTLLAFKVRIQCNVDDFPVAVQ